MIGAAVRCFAVSLDPPVGAIREAVARALTEDRAVDDATTGATVDANLRGRAVLLAKQPGIAAGLPVAAEVFRQLDEEVWFATTVEDGEWFAEDAELAVVEGPVAAILQGERVALNFAQRLSGIATATSLFVHAVKDTRAVILDTRKTTPGLRDLEKYAVRCGGGTNHRRDLAAMAMIKDNHREAVAKAGRTLADAVAAIRARTPGIEVEVEVDGLGELEAALAAAPEWILLDNMRLSDMAEAVRFTAGRAKLEASGNVTLDRVAEIAGTGVNAISAGVLTHSAPALDISLDLSF